MHLIAWGDGPWLVCLGVFGGPAVAKGDASDLLAAQIAAEDAAREAGIAVPANPPKTSDGCDLTQRFSVQNARPVDLIAAAERTLGRFDYAGMLARGIEHETLGGLATALDAAKQVRVYADPDDPNLGAGDPRVEAAEAQP